MLVRMANFDNTDWSDLGGFPDPGNTTTNGAITVTGVTVRGPFTFAAITAGVVPVKLNSFSVQKQNTSAKVSWSTELEINSREFIIERSADGINWTAAGTVMASGNSNITRYYSFIDPTPSRGINYYRLKSVDQDNRFVNSETRSLLFGASSTVLITPNPATDFIKVFMDKDLNTVSQIIVSDVNGRILNKYSTTDLQKKISTSGFAKGTYLVKVITGENAVTQKIVIQ
jgi:trimeric autotransporter adhesin